MSALFKKLKNGVILHKITSLVVNNNKDKIVLGRLVNGETVIDAEVLELAEQQGFPVDQSVHDKLAEEPAEEPEEEPEEAVENPEEEPTENPAEEPENEPREDEVRPLREEPKEVPEKKDSKSMKKPVSKPEVVSSQKSKQNEESNPWEKALSLFRDQNTNFMGDMEHLFDECGIREKDLRQEIEQLRTKLVSTEKELEGLKSRMKQLIGF